MSEHKPDCAYRRSREQFPDGWCCTCTCGANKPTPPAPTADEVREAVKEARSLWVESVHILDHEGAMVPNKVLYTLLTTLTQAQERECRQDLCEHIKNGADSITQCLDYQAQIAELRAELAAKDAVVAKLREDAMELNDLLTIAHMDGYHKGREAALKDTGGE